ncbi:DgyrCDS2810 [Dimorphilus gyrociliatus]|uniref:DgyrCDS2810 n=1 Tax=Dimorphilus gyrociliatus TaxID=2664684 RepID=A0A7I8VGH4_9ANNE|nr:DgyrCDS2810 [Dimorphilus gyrociliatus]
MQKFNAYLLATLFIGILIFSFASSAEDKPESEDSSVEVDQDKLEYTKGSLCNYCKYCKFCKLCDKDCPCEKSPQKPNCHMCKYCKFCTLCTVCDKVCQPNGFIDRMSAKLINAFSPSDANEDQVKKDLKTVEKWVKEEL